MSENQKRGKVIAICSGKGGVGKTSIAVNLAIALGKKNIDVAIVDGELQFGDIGLALDLQPMISIKDFADDQNQVDEYNVTNYLTAHDSGIQVLAAPNRPEYADLITVNTVKKVISLLRKNFDYIIIDAGHGINEIMLEIIEDADKLLVVSSLEVSALKNAKLMVETIHQLNMEEKIELVLNRYNMDSLIKPEEVPNMLKTPKTHYIPNNFKLASQGMNIGVPVVISNSKSDISKGIFKMAQSIFDNIGGNTPKKKGLSIGKMFSMK